MELVSEVGINIQKLENCIESTSLEDIEGRLRSRGQAFGQAKKRRLRKRQNLSTHGFVGK